MLKKTEQKFFAVWLTEYIVMVRIFQKQDLMEQENNKEIKQTKNSYFQLSIQLLCCISHSYVHYVLYE